VSYEFQRGGNQQLIKSPMPMYKLTNLDVTENIINKSAKGGGVGWWI